MEMVERAKNLATLAHKFQTRKFDKTPYIVHPERVVKRLMDWGVDNEKMLTAAWLHDVVEDVYFNAYPFEPHRAYQQLLSEIRDMDVMTLVYFLTKDLQRSRDKNVTHEQARNAMFAKLRVAPHAALVIKMADRVDNLYDYPTGKMSPYMVMESQHLLQMMEDRYEDVFMDARVSGAYNSGLDALDKAIGIALDRHFPHGVK